LQKLSGLLFGPPCSPSHCLTPAPAIASRAKIDEFMDQNCRRWTLSHLLHTYIRQTFLHKPFLVQVFLHQLNRTQLYAAQELAPECDAKTCGAKNL